MKASPGHLVRDSRATPALCLVNESCNSKRSSNPDHGLLKSSKQSKYCFYQHRKYPGGVYALLATVAGPPQAT